MKKKGQRGGGHEHLSRTAGLKHLSEAVTDVDGLTRPRRVVALNFVIKLVVLCGMMAACVLGAVTVRYPGKILFQIGIGLLLAHATELVHQCLHRTATGRAAWDQPMGVALSLATGVSFWRYTWDHFEHHKNVDKESFDYSYELMDSPSLAVRLLGFVRHVSMVDHYRKALRGMRLALSGHLYAELLHAAPRMRKSFANNIRRDYLLMAALLAAALLFSVAARTTTIIDVWLLPLLFVWGPTHAMVELPEHWKCDKLSKDAWVNARSIEAGWVARWFTNNNNNHVGHHHNMGVPMERLPEYERQLAGLHAFKHFERSYPRFYLRFFKFLYTGEPEPARADNSPNIRNVSPAR